MFAPSLALLAMLCGCPHGERPVAPARPRGTPETLEPAPRTAAEPAPEQWWTEQPPARWTTAPIAVATPAGPQTPPAAPTLVELRPRGRVDELSVSPNGALWITTDEAESFRADAFGDPWRPGTLDCTGADGRRAKCSRITFFTDRIAIATGYVGRGLDEYFLTENAGQSWERRSFGDPSAIDGQWIYDVHTTARGEAWMSGSHGRLHYSPDFGRTWTVRATPFDQSSRLHRLFMSGQRGIAGALGNAIKVTGDGGRTWTPIETPLDQRATSGAAPDPHEDDRIENVAIFGDWLLAQHSRHVYATPRATIRWRPVANATLSAFQSDREGRHLFALTNNREVVTLDRQLAATPIRGARVANPAIDLHVEGSVLYVLDESLGLTRVDARGARFTALLTQGDGPQEIASVRRAGDRLWGISPHGIYSSDDGGTRWRLRHSSERRWIGLAARGPDDLLVWDVSGTTEHFDARTSRLRPVAPLANAHVTAIVIRADRWIAFGGDQQHGQAWLSPDTGAAWSLLDRWTGPSARDAYPLPDGTTVFWSHDNTLRRTPATTPPTPAVPAPADRVELPTSTTLYFSDPAHGFIHGYIHHMGDHAWATRNAGTSWTPVPADAFPYLLVVPYRTGALAISGRSFSYEDTNRRELHYLEGTTRRLVHRSPEQITDVSISPTGQILLELDPDPETFDDSTGKHWLELRAD
jgi:photosystem II stability/assembly factor-like uncharacterized protein